MIGRNCIWAAAITLLIIHTYAWAEIYSWTDADGVRRFSNTPPPQKETVLRHTEIPYNRTADETRRAAEAQSWRQRKIELEKNRKTALDEKKSEKLTEQLKETKEKLKVLESKTEKALEAAQKAQEVSDKEYRRYRTYPYRPHGKSQRGVELGPNTAVRPRHEPRRELGPNTAVRPRHNSHPKRKADTAAGPPSNSRHPNSRLKSKAKNGIEIETAPQSNAAYTP